VDAGATPQEHAARSALWLPLFDELGGDPLPYAEAGATWWLPEFVPEQASLDQVRGVLRDGPMAL
jgi:hypothetical protein